VSVDEAHLADIEPEIFATVRNRFPDNVSVVIDNCYLGTNLLNYLSVVDIEAIMFSPQMVRNLNFYRDRVKMMSGIKQFADQIGLSAVARGVNSREEYLVISSLGIPYVSGSYVDSLAQGGGVTLELSADTRMNV
jgi:EAL domain-containing protein (putative c-di-GMP-specific phosphodiesterase class I)